ncbi:MULTISPECIES: F510_1955 family glycosylhydrolase [Rhodococcus]|nr:MULTISPECIES: glycosyl hydrolase [Rhodococcus]AUM19230.1 glycosyl hydrolase [Rhodococcus ruber]MBD8057240.1 exo-alpha-sialidase [Rhodococcus ruber]MCF8784664.1 exo-alpha-sialidase [Rhodococcus ruber]MCZ1075653.1 exo-alpha-sialidase [Rhodococcus sp. A5(2022)]MDO1482256.1 exo-alpha-sialidase [Rhodococcus ruber]
MSVPRLSGAVSALAAAALLVAGCSSAETSSAATAPSGALTAPSVTLAPALDHVHGLAVDAAGTVLAGTHSGLLAVDPSGATRKVGASDDDLMGLAGVPGTDTLVTSGHPGRSSSAPNPLGLRRSDDGGQTWSDRSLLGEVDFHALATDGTMVVGFDGTEGIRISTDGGTTWSAGARVAAASLAVTPAGIWAITPAGLERSTDLARTFTPITDAPALLMLAGTGDGLWGVDADGYAWRSRDGATWEQRVYVGQVETLTATGFETAYAATDEALYTLT